jgi:hypothetical protein
MCQRFDVTGNLKNFAKFLGTKQPLGSVDAERKSPTPRSSPSASPLALCLPSPRRPPYCDAAHAPHGAPARRPGLGRSRICAGPRICAATRPTPPCQCLQERARTVAACRHGAARARHADRGHGAPQPHEQAPAVAPSPLSFPLLTHVDAGWPFSPRTPCSRAAGPCPRRRRDSPLGPISHLLRRFDIPIFRFHRCLLYFLGARFNSSFGRSMYLIARLNTW